MNAGLEFLFALIFSSLFMLVWIIYEIVQAHRRRSMRGLPPPMADERDPMARFKRIMDAKSWE